MMNKMINRMPAMILLAALFMVSNIATATTTPAPNPIINSVVVKHLQYEGNKTYFMVQLQNTGGEKFSITIRDKNGEELFAETSREKAFEKKFQCENLQELGPITINIRSFKDGQEQTYKLNTSVRLVQDVTVQKLK